MLFTEMPLKGAFVIDLEPRGDERGFFARAFCSREFQSFGLNPFVAQTNVAFNHRAGTVRGLHFQYPPCAETKLVRCSRGAVVDVIVDLRPESRTYLKHIEVLLTADNRRALYVPQRFAHGYQVLEPATEVIYDAGQFYTPSAEGGVRYSDPRLAIQWPLGATDVSVKDEHWTLLEQFEPELRERMCSSA